VGSGYDVVERCDLATLGTRHPAEAWREVMQRTYVPFDLRPRPAAHERFAARGMRVRLGGVTLVEMEYGRGFGRRGAAEIAATDEDPLGVLVLRRGRLGLTLNGRSTTASPGQMVIWDGARQGSFEALEPGAKTTLILSRDRMRSVLPHYESVVGQVLPAARPAVRLLRQYVTAMTQVAASLDAAAREAAAGAALELTRAAVGAGAPLDRSAMRAALLTQIDRHIDQHLGDPALSPASIAFAHAISVRTLHTLFEEAGESVSATIRERRIARCHAELASSPGTPVSAIALRCGFRDASHFSRLFRRRFGVSPREVQAAAQRDAA
jgi:AraC family transcriptional regulator, positive regulator of tynA and feaB